MELGHGAKGGKVVELGSKHAAEGVADLKLLEHGAEAMEGRRQQSVGLTGSQPLGTREDVPIAPNFCREILLQDLKIAQSQFQIALMHPDHLQRHDRGDLSI